MSYFGDFYRRVRALVSDRPSNFGWLDDDVAGSGRPMTLEQVRWIRERGIDVVISLTEEPLPSEWIGEAGLIYHHEPIPDHSAPNPQQVKRIVERILEEIHRGRKVLIHCAAGLGRTGTILASYLVARRGLTAEEAINLVRQRRPGSIEPAQEWSVREYYRRYAQGKSSSHKTQK